MKSAARFSPSSTASVTRRPLEQFDGDDAARADDAFDAGTQRIFQESKPTHLHYLRTSTAPNSASCATRDSIETVQKSHTDERDGPQSVDHHDVALLVPDGQRHAVGAATTLIDKGHVIGIRQRRPLANANRNARLNDFAGNEALNIGAELRKILG
jgi:hypothetical protein